MICKACNTRFGDRMSNCPNCGRGAAVVGLKGAPGAKAAAEPTQLGDSSGELELDETVIDTSPHVSASPVFTPDPSTLREMLAGEPQMLEAGLAVYTHKKKAVGAAYATDVGEIDLLATDADGSLVVILVGEKEQGDELVTESLQRIGWVRKHLCKPSQNVRGIVVVEQPPESLCYAAAAVSDTVAFKTYRVALTFEDVES